MWDEYGGREPTTALNEAHGGPKAHIRGVPRGFFVPLRRLISVTCVIGVQLIAVAYNETYAAISFILHADRYLHFRPVLSLEVYFLQLRFRGLFTRQDGRLRFASRAGNAAG